MPELISQNFRQSAILANFNSYWLELAKPDTVSNLVKLTSSRVRTSNRFSCESIDVATNRKKG